MSPHRHIEKVDLEIIIHGHFYQPPREDPWTEEIEDEPSAAPWTNWNERINAECYRPNAFSRVLGEYGRVRAIQNNYAWLSYNFGPTLLSWMDRYDPETLAAIVRSDVESAARNQGHGNAIAQAYNHMIMPLADQRDRATQIAWGRADFMHRFNREPESMWMPETAVCAETMEQLLQAGMKYVILSPHQAEEIQLPDGSWRKNTDGRFDTSCAYFVRTATGKLPVFFYHPELSTDISFNHLLRSSETFVDRLVGAGHGVKMINIATDGEIYGHHEPFGDMCLAYSFHEHLSGRSGRAGKKIRITNYGAFLDRHPPTREARLRPGGSSWSCAHGVERWRADCGCKINHGGSWNQQWRAPLRNSLDLLRDSLRKVFETEGRNLFTDPWAARDAYIEVVLAQFDPERRKAFAAKWFRQDATSEHAWRLLESQRNAMLMYTSCGWFFDDLAGIEPKQLMLYAARAVASLGPLAPTGITEKFLRKLKDAKSNDPAAGDGARIYRAITHPRMKAKVRMLNQAILANFAGIEPHRRARYSVQFEGEAFWQADSHVEITGPAAYEALGMQMDSAANLGRGTAVVRDIRTEGASRYAWVVRFKPLPPETLIFEVGQVFRWPGGDPRDKPWEKIRPVVGERRGVASYGVKDLFRGEARKLLDASMTQAEKGLDVLLRGTITELEPVVTLSEYLKIPPDPSFIALLSAVAGFLWRLHIRNGRHQDAKRLESRLESLGLKVAKERVATEFSKELDRLAKPLRAAGARSEEFRSMLNFLRHAQVGGILLDARFTQESVFHLLKGEGTAMIGAIVAGGERGAYENLLDLLEAAERLNIDIAYERKLLEPVEGLMADDPKYWP